MLVFLLIDSLLLSLNHEQNMKAGLCKIASPSSLGLKKSLIDFCLERYFTPMNSLVVKTGIFLMLTTDFNSEVLNGLRNRYMYHSNRGI